MDDVGFFIELLDDLARRTSVDRARVYATGLSNGAMMAYRLAAEASDRITDASCIRAWKGGTKVELWKFTDSGHVWPGGTRGYLEHWLGRSTDLLDANAEMWKFFKRWKLPEARAKQNEHPASGTSSN